ncbi:thioredoxin family protein [Dechloromonas sp. HYN0024]|uniref:thioredoxin family protein n=1 Tax=Dechloromonas sp. HYN0024 TaxID=2231055 RepID=UPI000E42DDD7|nr:thioredoxin family protein [Dechloromonas sp. HYN0024]AXS80908.1 thioredoxin family protein [Dechloromonas sp. HYN0024]
MVALNPPVCDFGLPAIAFDLPGTDGKRHTLASCRGTNGLLVMFICNHCPYVKAIIDRLIHDCRDLQKQGIGCVAIMSNDVAAYPEDSPAAMARWAAELSFPFPYLYDATQAVARAYGAVCTPDFFGYNSQLELQYRGRLDASGRQPAAPEARRELHDAMLEIARSGRGPAEQTASIGCSIKWQI